MAAWRLPWYTVCPHHQIMLSSDCSQCGRAQRATNARVDRVHGVTTLCSRRFADVVGRGDRRCAHLALQGQADHPLAGCAADTNGRPSRQDLDVAESSKRIGADVGEIVDSLVR